MNDKTEQITLSNPPFTEEKLLQILLFLDLNDARTVFMNFIGRWMGVGFHIKSTSGVVPQPIVPGEKQSLVFAPDINELRTILNPSTTQVGCVLCLSDIGTATEANEVLSVMLVGLDNSSRPTNNKIIEKWPTKAMIKDPTKFYTIREGSAKVVTDLLSTPPAGTSTNYIKAKTMLEYFERQWTHLQADVTSPAGPVPVPRPNLKMDDIVVAFQLPRAPFDTLISAPGVDSIVGLFGCNENDAASSAKADICPFFIGLNTNGEPVTDIVFTDSFSKKSYYTDYALVRDLMLTHP
ncbi:MAG: hypothetical protein U0X40_01860 [Ferruginibacter sp.]